MQKYGVNELRKMFLEFFESKGHLAMKSFSLVPHNDKSAAEAIFYRTRDSAEQAGDHLPEVHPHRGH